MSNLKYRTRGESSPNGKPRVYFCGHERDLASFLEPVCEDILSISNCAVFYYDGEPGDDWTLELGQMQLFVMPVTHWLLNTQNRALDVEFRFAVEKHIPVLPLMQESGQILLTIWVICLSATAGSVRLHRRTGT